MFDSLSLSSSMLNNENDLTRLEFGVKLLLLIRWVILVEMAKKDGLGFTIGQENGSNWLVLGSNERQELSDRKFFKTFRVREAKKRL